jgi:hypothetical protein
LKKQKEKVEGKKIRRGNERKERDNRKEGRIEIRKKE